MGEARPPGRPWLSPYLCVTDVAKTLEFYERAFGFERGSAYEDENGVLVHAEMSYRGALIAMGPTSVAEPWQWNTPRRLGGKGLLLRLYTDDVDALHDRALQAGAREGFAPQEMFWGDRVCLLFDPDGHAWNFATNVADWNP